MAAELASTTRLAPAALGRGQVHAAYHQGLAMLQAAVAEGRRLALLVGYSHLLDATTIDFLACLSHLGGSWALGWGNSIPY